MVDSSSILLATSKLLHQDLFLSVNNIHKVANPVFIVSVISTGVWRTMYWLLLAAAASSLLASFTPLLVEYRSFYFVRLSSVFIFFIFFLVTLMYAC